MERLQRNTLIANCLLTLGEQPEISHEDRHQVEVLIRTATFHFVREQEDVERIRAHAIRLLGRL